MFGSLLSFMAARAAGDAVDGIARRALWGSVAALFLLFALILGLMATYWILAPMYGAVETALGMMAVCLAIGFVALMMPLIIERSKKAAAAKPAASNPVESTVAAVKEETEAAVDYFGAVQVVASAFMFGLGTARQLRRRA